MGLLADIDRSLGVATLRKQGSSVWPDMRLYHGETVEHGARTRDLLGSYRAHTWVNVAVKAIANCVADVPIIAVREGTGKPRQKGLVAYKAAHPRLSYRQARDRYVKDIGGTVLESHWALDLVDHPLEEAQVTRHELLQAIVTYLETAGDAYVEKVYGDQGKQTVKGLWPRIDPRYVWIIPGTERLIDGYLYRQSGRAIVFAPEEIIHLAYFHPENPYYGLAPAEVVKNSLVADLRAVEWNRLFFENGAIPEIAVTTQQRLSADDAELIRKRWVDRFRDRKSRGVAVLGSGTDVKEITRTHKDMEFLNLRKWTRDEVLAAYGVPPIYAGVREEGNRSISEVERRIFWENTILPRLGKIEDALNFGLMSGERSIRLCFDISAIEALQEDVATKAATGQTLINQGWTLNEIREDYWHLEPGEGDGVNAIYAPPMATPAGYIKGYTPTEEPDEAEEPTAPTGPEEEETPQETPEEGKAKTKAPLLEVARFVAQSDLEKFLAMAREHLPKIAAAGGGRGADVLLGLGVPVPDNWEQTFNFQPHIEEWVDAHMADTVKEIGGVTQEEAAATIKRGMEQGRNWKEIARDLRETFKGMSAYRAGMIARTEGGKAVSYGQHFLYEKTDVAYHGWMCQFFNSREAHMAAHNAYFGGIPLEEAFEVGGERMTAPRQGAKAENNINCYCEEIPMMEKGQAPEAQPGELIGADPAAEVYGEDDAVREAEQEGYAAHEGWDDKLTAEERKAIVDYTGDLAEPLNRRLRDGVLDERDTATVTRLDDAISKAGSFAEDKRPVVYRGVLLGPNEGIPSGADLAGMSEAERVQATREAVVSYSRETFKPGTVFSGGGGYQSTSFRVDPALDASSKADRVGAVFEIRAQSGAYLKPGMSRWNDERELLLGRNTEYRVHKVIPSVKFETEFGVRERTVIQVEQIK